MTQSNSQPAGFLRRLLAYKIDTLFWLLPISFGIYLVTYEAKATQDLVTGIVYYLTFAIFPLIIGSIFLYPLLNSKFGGSPGKLITGLRVINNEGKYLNYKLSFFRNTVGHLFSALFFWLGYFSVIKDPEKKAWHDKAVGTNVVAVKPLWPVALLILALLLGIHFYLISQGISNISRIFRY